MVHKSINFKISTITTITPATTTTAAAATTTAIIIKTPVLLHN